MKLIKNPLRENWNVILERPTFTAESLDQIVNEVFVAIQKKGDTALKSFTLKFDKVEIDNLKVSVDEIESSTETFKLSISTLSNFKVNDFNAVSPFF